MLYTYRSKWAVLGHVSYVDNGEYRLDGNACRFTIAMTVSLSSLNIRVNISGISGNPDLILNIRLGPTSIYNL